MYFNLEHISEAVVTYPVADPEENLSSEIYNLIEFFVFVVWYFQGGGRKSAPLPSESATDF